MNKNKQQEIKMSRVTFQDKRKVESAPKQSSSTSATSVKPAPQPQAVNGSAKPAERREPAFSLKGLLAAKRLTKELKSEQEKKSNNVDSAIEIKDQLYHKMDAAKEESQALKTCIIIQIRASKPRLRIHHRMPITIINDQIPAGSANPKERFPCAEAKQLIGEYLASRLASVKYDPVACASLTTNLCDEIKQMVKRATPARYKLICNVTIGSSDAEDIVVTSQCLWDPHADNFASCSYVNKTLFCVVSVYAVYVE